MFKNQKVSNHSFQELSDIIDKYYNDTIKIANKLKTDLDYIDEVTANMLLLSVLKLNNAIDDFYSRLYYYRFGKLMTFFQYLESLSVIGLSTDKIEWIKNLREYRNTLVYAVDAKEIITELFSNKVKVLKFLIIVEKTVTFTQSFYTDNYLIPIAA